MQKIHLIVVILLSFVLFSCKDETPVTPKQNVFEIDGYVFDKSTNSPIKDVIVSIDTSKAVTDSAGYFHIKNITQNSFLLRLRHDYYEQIDTTIFIDKNSSFNFYLISIIPIIEHDIFFRSDRDGQFDIYKMNFYGEEVTRMTTSEGITNFKFTSEGLKIVYQKATGGLNDIYMMNSDGTNEKQLTDLSAAYISWDISEDGKKLVYSSTNGYNNLFLVDLETAHTEIFTDTTRYGYPTTWWKSYFLSGGDKIVCRATDYALKVVDTKSRLIRTLCERCIYEDHNWQVFPNEEKVLLQQNQFTYIFDVGIPWSEQILPFPAASAKLTPDGKGFVYGPMYSDSKGIMMYDFSTQTHQLLKTINWDQFNSSFSSFSFTPEGSYIIWNSGRQHDSSPIKDDIFGIDILGDNFRRLTDHPASDRNAVFQPN